MEISNLFSHLNSISSALYTHWNFFSAVALGIAAGLAIKGAKIDALVGVLLAVGLTMFLVSNFIRIYETTEELKMVKDEITLKIDNYNDSKNKKLSPKFKNYYINEYLGVNPYWKMFHIVIDAFLILVVFARTDWKKWLTK